HVYTVWRSGEQTKLLTPGDFDVIDVAGIDEKDRRLYYYASPDNATQKYLYCVDLDGKNSRRVTPAASQGTHDYQLSPDCRWAVHTYSSFGTLPLVELVELPGHKVVRTLVDNRKVQDKVNKLHRWPHEFFRVPVRVGEGDGVELDGWCLKPPDFDPKKRYPVLF